MNIIRRIVPALALVLLIGMIAYVGGIGEGQYALPSPSPTSVQSKPLDAVIVSYNAPETVNHEDSYQITVTVQNTGSEVWSEACKTRLCIWQDGTDWGYRVYLPQKVTVMPGEVYTFTLEGFVLPEAEETLLEFQMLCEGIVYFGERVPVSIKAVS